MTARLPGSCRNTAEPPAFQNTDSNHLLRLTAALHSGPTWMLLATNCCIATACSAPTVLLLFGAGEPQKMSLCRQRRPPGSMSANSQEGSSDLCPSVSLLYRDDDVDRQTDRQTDTHTHTLYNCITLITIEWTITNWNSNELTWTTYSSYNAALHCGCTCTYVQVWHTFNQT